MAIRPRAARLLSVLGLFGAVSCAPVAEPASSAQQSEAKKTDHEIRREQLALEKRRLQLEEQVLAELRKLRANRQASTGDAEPANDDAADGADLLVFGGAKREVFLGCLCTEGRPDSVFNMLGEHGSDDSPVSIRNKFSPYGAVHEDTSACNPKATHPPAILTSEGKSLGLLTLNTSLKRGITAPSVTGWLSRMCGE